MPLGKRLKVRMHYWICVWCKRYEQQLKFLREAMHKHPAPDEPSPGAALSSDARQRIKAAPREPSK